MHEVSYPPLKYFLIHIRFKTMHGGLCLPYTVKISMVNMIFHAYFRGRLTLCDTSMVDMTLCAYFRGRYNSLCTFLGHIWAKKYFGADIILHAYFRDRHDS